MKCECGFAVEKHSLGDWIHVKWNGIYWKAYLEGNNHCRNPKPSVGVGARGKE